MAILLYLYFLIVEVVSVQDERAKMWYEITQFANLATNNNVLLDEEWIAGKRWNAWFYLRRVLTTVPYSSQDFWLTYTYRDYFYWRPNYKVLIIKK